MPLLRRSVVCLVCKVSGNLSTELRGAVPVRPPIPDQQSASDQRTGRPDVSAGFLTTLREADGERLTGAW
jgi:hypothetical protein